MERAHISREAAKKISGHKTRAVCDSYNIVSGMDIEDAGPRCWCIQLQPLREILRTRLNDLVGFLQRVDDLKFLANVFPRDLEQASQSV